MPRTSRPLAAILVALVIAPVAGAHWQNDAGSGDDAPNSPAHALALAYGSYTGYLGNSQDWYAFPASAEPVCLVATSGGYADSLAELRVDTGTTTLALEGDGNAADGALAVPASVATRFGLMPQLNDEEEEPSRPGTYFFSVNGYTRADLGEGDAGTGGDVGNSAAEAATLTRPCATGTFQPGLDPRDVYAVDAEAGDTVRLSFVQVTPEGTAYLWLVDPDGTLVGNVANGAAQRFTLDQTGRYTAVVAGSDPDSVVPVALGMGTTGGVLDPITYLLALDEDPRPPGSGCRPACL